MRLVVLVLLIVTSVAHADVGVVVTGDPNMQAAVMNHVQRWVQDKKHTLVAAPLGDATTALVDCFVIEDMACARKAFDEHAKAANVVFVRVDMQAGEARSYMLNAHWFAKDQAPVTDKRACTHCDDTKLAVAVNALMTDLASKATKGQGKIKISGGSPDITIKIDGIEVGAAPIERDLAPGSHEVVFVQNGSPVDVQRIQVEAGAVVTLAAPRIAAPPPAAGTARRSRALPVALIVGGIAALAAGSTFLYYGSLRGPDEPYVYTNATEIGLPLALAGAFAFGAGTSLWFSASESAANVGVARSF